MRGKGASYARVWRDVRFGPRAHACFQPDAPEIVGFPGHGDTGRHLLENSCFHRQSGLVLFILDICLAPLETSSLKVR